VNPFLQECLLFMNVCLNDNTVPVIKCSFCTTSSHCKNLVSGKADRRRICVVDRTFWTEEGSSGSYMKTKAKEDGNVGR
jgi:hypothetical protein